MRTACWRGSPAGESQHRLVEILISELGPRQTNDERMRHDDGFRAAIWTVHFPVIFLTRLWTSNKNKSFTPTINQENFISIFIIIIILAPPCSSLLLLAPPHHHHCDDIDSAEPAYENAFSIYPIAIGDVQTFEAAL